MNNGNVRRTSINRSPACFRCKKKTRVPGRSYCKGCSNFKTTKWVQENSKSPKTKFWITGASHRGLASSLDRIFEKKLK